MTILAFEFDPVAAVAGFLGDENFSVAITDDGYTVLDAATGGALAIADPAGLAAALAESEAAARVVWAEEQIRAVAEAARERLIGGASPTEVASWPNEAARAHRFQDGVASAEDIAALTLEAAGRGQDPAELAAVQIEKEGRFAALVARIDGAQAAALKAVAAAAEVGSGDPDHVAKIVSGFAGDLPAAAPAG